VSAHCFFSIREVTSVTIIAGDMQAVTDVSEMAQELMNTCEGAMAIMGCADTEKVGHMTRHLPRSKRPPPNWRSWASSTK
jgi:hypothetical protein